MKKCCAICKGQGITLFGEPCSFCRQTGEANNAAESFVRNHTCLCITLDRKNCPVCGKKCHHNTPNRPKLLISP